MDKARNDLSAAVPKFCLALEEHRRTPDGRVRTSQELLATFFPHDEKVCTDRILKHLPNEVRGPIIAAWGIRGVKAALRDSDEKVQSVLYDALLAGDVDHTAFEEGLTAETLVRWVPHRGPVDVLAWRQAHEAGHPQGDGDGLRAIPLRRALVSRDRSRPEAAR